MIETKYVALSTRGDGDIHDITMLVQRVVTESRLRAGVVTVFVPGSTAAVTTVEYESGLVKDLQEAFQRLFPRGSPYHHDSRWGDGNGYAHVRASFLGPSLTVPFDDGRLLLGTWQQIIFADFDNRPRQRQIVIQVLGEA